MKRKLYGFTSFNQFACLTDSPEDAINLWHSRLRSYDIYSIEIDETYLEKDVVSFDRYGGMGFAKNLVSILYNNCALRNKYKFKQQKEVAEELISNSIKKNYNVYFLNINNCSNSINKEIEDIKEKGNYTILKIYKNKFSKIDKMNESSSNFLFTDEKRNDLLKIRETLINDILRKDGLFFSFIKIVNPEITYKNYIKILNKYFTFRWIRMK